MHRRADASVALLLVVIAATVGILVSRQQPVVPPPDDPPGPAPRTLLVQLRDSRLLAQGSVIMGVEKDSRLANLWWTGQWWIDQIGVQEVSAAELGRKPVPYLVDTVQNQLGVRVDDAWVLDRLAFAGLVDAVSGVRLEIPQVTVYVTDDDTTAVLPAGMRTLAGAQAADYVLDASLVDEQARLQRFQAVWDQIVRRFPTDPDKARTLVVSLGALSKATMPAEQLAVLLADAHDLRITGDYDEVQVALDGQNAVRVRPAQGVRRAYALDPFATARRLSRVFDGFAGPDEPVARVASVVIRSEAVPEIRSQLSTRSWRSAWGGRAITSSTTVTVDPSVPAAQVVTLEQALGITPGKDPVPLAEARVAVAADAADPVGS
ncbi:MAG: LCP family protein [Micrococcales bacterium]|nr:LCP family protein [Micrococcales bacterium]